MMTRKDTVGEALLCPLPSAVVNYSGVFRTVGHVPISPHLEQRSLKAPAEPFLMILSTKSRTERAPAGAQKAPKSTEPKSTVIGDPKETKKYRKVTSKILIFCSL
jgi:hypothetical protein